jgi:hypothetical protein
VAELTAVSLLTIHSEVGGRGRPKRIFEIDQACVKKYEMAKGCFNGRNLDLAEYVIAAASLKAEKVRSLGQEVPSVVKKQPATEDGIDRAPLGRAGNLSLANRLLLAVLLSRSNELGVVSDLGSAELCALVGLPLSSLPQRLRMLTALGFVRRHVPGIASPVFSKKLKSIYILNLNHQQLSPAGDRLAVLLHQKALSDDKENYLQAVWIDRNACLRGRTDEPPTPMAVVRLLRNAPRHAFAQIECFICKWASELLSLHWSMLTARSNAYQASVLIKLQKKSKEFFNQPMLDPKYKKVLDEEEVVSFFCRTIIDLAMECRERFSDVQDFPLSGRKFFLVSAFLEEGYQSIAILATCTPEEECKSLWLTTDQNDTTTTYNVDRESGFSLKIRKQAGLLTPVQAK